MLPQPMRRAKSARPEWEQRLSVNRRVIVGENSICAGRKVQWSRNVNVASGEPKASERAESPESGIECPEPDRSSSLNSTRYGLCYVIFFLSGAAALVYEISWSRQIGLLFGHTVQAAAVVLAAYFAGMAVGYWIGAAWARRIRPLLGYGVAESVAAGWAFLIPVLLGWSQTPAFAAWLSSSSFVAQTAARAAFCFLLLLPATTALGATLPMMAEFFAFRRRDGLADPANAARVTLAYALNTAGALVGVLSATFFLMVVVGVRGSSFVAAAVSAVCAIAAFLTVERPKTKGNKRRGAGVERQGAIAESRIVRPESRAERNPGANSGLLPLDSRLFWLLLAALSGFGTLALEVLYIRMFSLVFHNSTYTFGAVVAVFVASLAVGAAVASRLQRRYPVESLIGWIAGAGGLATVLSVPVFVWLTGLDYFRFGESFSQYLGGAFSLVAVVVGPPITMLGMLLPLAWKGAGHGVGTSEVVGRLSAVNTVFAAVGALAASFLLLPWIGLWASFVGLGGSFFLVGFLELARNRRLSWACGGALVLGGLGLYALQGAADAESRRDQQREQLVRRWNSPYGWIDVVRSRQTGALKVRQNLHYRFGRTGEHAREFRQAHIPLLLHPQPREVLFLGLGTGLTAGGAVPHGDVDSIVAVELIPEVVEAARWLADYNYGIVDHPKSNIRIDDARHYLLATDRQFDVIVSDLFVPWESKSGYLYTVEHYRVAQSRLKPGGLFCQWLPLYQLGTREFELIADSFSSVFPVTTIWWGDMDAAKPVIALVGSDTPLEIDASRLSKRLGSLWDAIGSADAPLRTSERFFDNYLGDWTSRHPAILNTDEHPRVEFWTPVSNRDRTLLNGLVLMDYYDRVLARLPSGSVRVEPSAASAMAPSKTRRARQRFVLFGEIIR